MSYRFKRDGTTIQVMFHIQSDSSTGVRQATVDDVMMGSYWGSVLVANQMMDDLRARFVGQPLVKLEHFYERAVELP